MFTRILIWMIIGPRHSLLFFDIAYILFFRLRITTICFQLKLSVLTNTFPKKPNIKGSERWKKVYTFLAAHCLICIMPNLITFRFWMCGQRLISVVEIYWKRCKNSSACIWVYGTSISYLYKCVLWTQWLWNRCYVLASGYLVVSQQLEPFPSVYICWNAGWGEDVIFNSVIPLAAQVGNVWSLNSEISEVEEGRQHQFIHVSQVLYE